MALVVYRGPADGRVWEAGWVKRGFLAVGSLGDAQDVENLRKEGITHVLTVASRLDVWENEEDGATPDGITHLQIDIDDHPEADLLSVLPRCIDFLHGSLGGVWPPDGGGGNVDDEESSSAAVLVHCASGISRSVAVTAAFLMITAGMGLDNALTIIRRARPHANPNLGFQYKLRCLERAGGNVAAASRLFEEEIEAQGGEKITDIMVRQRQTANELHSRVDAIEEKLAARSSGGGAPRGHPLWTELMICLDKLDEESSKPGGYLDKPAAAIRRSACSKANRLLQGQP